MGEFSKSFSVKNMKPAMFFATLVLAIVAGHEGEKNKKVSSIDVEILTRNVRESKKENCRMEDCMKKNGKEKRKGKIKGKIKGKGRTKGKLKRKGKGRRKGKGKGKGKRKKKEK